LYGSGPVSRLSVKEWSKKEKGAWYGTADVIVPAEFMRRTTLGIPTVENCEAVPDTF